MLNVNKGSVVPKMSEQMRWCAGPKPNSHPLIGMVYQFFSLSKPPKRSVVVGGSALFKVVGPWGKVQPMRLSIFRKPTVCCAQCCIRGTNRSRNPHLHWNGLKNHHWQSKPRDPWRPKDEGLWKDHSYCHCYLIDYLSSEENHSCNKK